MSTRSLLRHIFRHGPRDKTSEDGRPLLTDQTTTKRVSPAANKDRDPVALEKSPRVFSNHTMSPPSTPERFRLEGIVEEDTDDVFKPVQHDISSPTKTTSSVETTTSLGPDLSTFSTRDLVNASIEEAKGAISAHLDTIRTTLALLGTLDGFSATITVLKQEMLENKEACEDKMAMLHAVEQAVEEMVFTGEAQEGTTERE
jgi:hypothetical protein